MGFRTFYTKSMDRLQSGLMFLSGISLVLMSLFICWQVYTRYFLNSASFWTEPISILLVFILTFFGGAAVYRRDQHIALEFVYKSLPKHLHQTAEALIHLLMLLISIFMMTYGWSLVAATMNQTLPDIVWIPVGVSYMPIPLGGFFTTLFLVEKVFFRAPVSGSPTH